MFDIRGKSSFGCLLRDEKGFFIAGYGGSFAGALDPNIVEAMAFREALSWLKKRSVHHVHIELDSLTVVQAFDNKNKDSSYLGSIIADYHQLVKDLRSYSVYFVRRSANSAAHIIAREAGSMSDRKEWLSMPSFLIDVLSSDLQ